MVRAVIVFVIVLVAVVKIGRGGEVRERKKGL